MKAMVGVIDKMTPFLSRGNDIPCIFYITSLCTKLKVRKRGGGREGEKEGGRKAKESLNLIEGQSKFASGYKTASQ